MVMTAPNPKGIDVGNPTLLITPEGEVANVGKETPEILATGGGGSVTTIVPKESIVPPTTEAEKPNPYTNTLPVTTPTVPYNVPPAPPTSLDGIVTLSKTTSDRQYRKGSGVKVADDFIVVTNTSNVLTVAVNFTGTAGVTFDPTHFNLNPLEQKTITTKFDFTQFESLPEGLNQINAIVDVSAVTMTEAPVTVTRPAIILPPAYQPPDNPNLGVFPIQPPPEILSTLTAQTTAGASGGTTGGVNVQFDNTGDTFVATKQGIINQI